MGYLIEILDLLFGDYIDAILAILGLAGVLVLLAVPAILTGSPRIAARTAADDFASNSHDAQQALRPALLR